MAAEDPSAAQVMMFPFPCRSIQHPLSRQARGAHGLLRPIRQMAVPCGVHNCGPDQKHFPPGPSGCILT